ncbi:hypothetical protein LXA47_20695 [Massilia sp. P8910]|uniref:hypothetical protein n=1 Tax=Massilia antarctica TaxID=2765360 RepID=UPI0006BB8FBD|nr:MULTISPECIES: hypothetical protein [Massilia]MCE3606005.1 hypothetical protein [Massilia antarctica]MCY0916178.1 hypothetical protein [Massilia sp. H27-R4]CUI07999.1 hypothetical protein BN2497_10775 [Janthinobacterium sp. CG23_2]CUU31785.1 hypothetical protein BN3177_10775 [Janthinobacterium sp. CG23_2]
MEAAQNTLPAIVVERLPRLVRAIRCLSAREIGDESVILADELAGITAMVAEKFTNDRTAEGIQKALLLTVGCVSLGLEHELMHEGDEAALDFLIEHGAEHAFQAGFRMVRDLAALPEDSLVGEYDQDPVYAQRRMKDLFVDICSADPHQNWSGYEKFEVQYKQRKAVQAIVRAAGWLRRHHYAGPINDADLNAEGVIAVAIIFAIEGGGRIVARTGQADFERLVKSVRKNKPDYEEGWAALMKQVPAQHQPVIAERIASYRTNCTVIQKIRTRTAMKTLFAEFENYAGSELDADYG